MNIPKDLLAEKNYSGTRLIEVTDPTIKALQEEISSLQKEINPILDRLNENYYTKVDPLYIELKALQEKLTPVKEQMAALFSENKDDLDLIEQHEQKAQLIKNKLVVLINDVVKPELGEFEKALHTVVQDDKLYVEVQDEIEEKVKQLRAKK